MIVKCGMFGASGCVRRFLGVYAMNMKKSFVSAAVAVLGLCGMVAPAYSQMEDVNEIEPQVVLVEVELARCTFRAGVAISF